MNVIYVLHQVNHQIYDLTSTKWRIQLIIISYWRIKLFWSRLNYCENIGICHRLNRSKTRLLRWRWTYCHTKYEYCKVAEVDIFFDDWKNVKEPFRRAFKLNHIQTMFNPHWSILYQLYDRFYLHCRTINSQRNLIAQCSFFTSNFCSIIKKIFLFYILPFVLPGDKVFLGQGVLTLSPQMNNCNNCN
jgi:hypothetical protein